MQMKGPKLLIIIVFLGQERILREPENLFQPLVGESLNSPSRKSPLQPVESWPLCRKPISLGFQNVGLLLPEGFLYLTSLSHSGMKQTPLFPEQGGCLSYRVDAWLILSHENPATPSARPVSCCMEQLRAFCPCDEPGDHRGYLTATNSLQSEMPQSEWKTVLEAQ